jgi:signal transduction histidine kinase
LILGHATFLKELVGSEFTDQLDTIVRNATKLKDIVENLSDVDNFQTGAARVRSNKVSMAKVVDDTILSFQDEAKSRNITLKADLENKPFFIEADGVKIGIVVSNLVKNALQFTEANGHINLKVEEDSGYLKVSVSDDGIGIPTKDLPRVFERFFQVESHLTRRTNGMGLGLAVAKSMIDLHNGRIWAESEEGKGSTFTFLLPIEKGANPTTSTSPFVE